VTGTFTFVTVTTTTAEPVTAARTPTADQSAPGSTVVVSVTVTETGNITQRSGNAGDDQADDFWQFQEETKPVVAVDVAAATDRLWDGKSGAVHAPVDLVPASAEEPGPSSPMALDVLFMQMNELIEQENPTEPLGWDYAEDLPGSCLALAGLLTGLALGDWRPSPVRDRRGRKVEK
jgi:hypothetical protein